jgi:serine/threonine-protein kinase HipA
VAGYFRVPLAEADNIIDDFRGRVAQWRVVANSLRLPAREQKRMAAAFRLVE